MCWHLTVSVPAGGVGELSKLLAPAGGMMPEAIGAVASAVGRGEPAFAVGAGCACSLYRAEASDAERIRRKAKRDGWSDAKLRRALAGAADSTGLDSAVREALATVAERHGPVRLLLFWDGKGAASFDREAVRVPAARLRVDAEAVREGQLLEVTA